MNWLLTKDFILINKRVKARREREREREVSKRERVIDRGSV